MSLLRLVTAFALLCSAPAQILAATTEFCLDGHFDLGARYQGLSPRAGEFYAARWCVVTEDDSDRVLLSLTGQSNPDIDGSWVVAFIPPDLVRIINAESPPNVEFRTPKSVGDAARTRRMDPRRVVEELSDSEPVGFSADIVDGRLVTIESVADLPLRGRVPVIWRWGWDDPDAPVLRLEVDGELVFRGHGDWRGLDDATSIWESTPGATPVNVPGEYWPAQIAMDLHTLSDGAYLVRTVRTGFQHLVIDTAEGLVVADAPAGWVELYQVPPADLVPELGISGLSERLIEFLGERLPDRPLRAVVLTHHHDDHVGGARAFAAAGAEIFAPQLVADFLEIALNRRSMPEDRLSNIGGNVTITPVEKPLRLHDERMPVDILPIGSGPHSVASLGVIAGNWFYQSDLHVPNSEADSPREDRAGTECWFAEWAVANLPEDTVVINTHSSHQTPVSRLARYLASRQCAGAPTDPSR